MQTLKKNSDSDVVTNNINKVMTNNVNKQKLTTFEQLKLKLLGNKEPLSPEKLNLTNTEKNTPKSQYSWTSFDDDVEVSENFFNCGIVLTKQSSLSDSDIINIEKVKNKTMSKELKFRLNANLYELVPDGKISSKRHKYYTESLSLLKNALQTSGISLPAKNAPYVTKCNRRTDNFLLLSTEGKGTYVHPWLSKNSNVTKKDFPGFQVAVMAGCLSGINGGNLERKSEEPFIKHHFPSGTKIDMVLVEKKKPYNYVMLQELDFHLKMLRAFAHDKKEGPLLVYHLPDFDYVFLGLKLLFSNEMTEGAFTDFIKVLFTESISHRIELSKVAVENNSKIEIVSPFACLFSTINKELKNITAKDILTVFKLDVKSDKFNEETFVKNCIAKLMCSDLNPKAYKVWNDFIKKLGSVEKIKTFEALFKIANAAVIGMASRNRAPNEVCTVLPITEKQIPLTFQKLTAKDNNYPAVFNFTMMERVIPYSRLNLKGPCYYARNTSILYNLLNKILTAAQKNASKCIEKTYNTQVQFSSVKELVENNPLETRKQEFRIEDFLKQCLKLGTITKDMYSTLQKVSNSPPNSPQNQSVTPPCTNLTNNSLYSLK